MVSYWSSSWKRIEFQISSRGGNTSITSAFSTALSATNWTMRRVFPSSAATPRTPPSTTTNGSRFSSPSKFAAFSFHFGVGHTCRSWFVSMKHLVKVKFVFFSDIDMAFIVDYAGKINTEKVFDKNKEKIDKLVEYMNDHFKFRRAHKMGYFSWITFNSAFPSVLYSITKLMFIANVILQVRLVCKFLSVDSWTWGFDVSVYSFSAHINLNFSSSKSLFTQLLEVPSFTLGLTKESSHPSLPTGVTTASSTSQFLSDASTSCKSRSPKWLATRRSA